jgi:biotin carboxyl carrier protein
MKRDLETKLALDGKETPVKASLDGTKLTVSLDGGAPKTFEAFVQDGEVTLRAADGRIVHAFVSSDLGVTIHGRAARVERVQAGTKRSARSAEETALEAPMPGTCREVFVAAGDKVEKGQRLVLIEAMKMEHEIRAPRAGVVSAVRAKKGEPVAPGTPLVELGA